MALLQFCLKIDGAAVILGQNRWLCCSFDLIPTNTDPVAQVKPM
jgi:hypothetical protein